MTESNRHLMITNQLHDLHANGACDDERHRKVARIIAGCALNRNGRLEIQR